MAWGPFNTGGGGGADTPTAAANVTYDNSKTKIDAANVQEALDYTLGLAQPRLTVTIDAGSQLTITCGDEEITGQTDGEGTFTTNLPMLGEWTIQAQKDGQTATQTVEVEQVGQFYTVEMAYFSATLTATAVAGATVTATCGETVVTGQAAGNGQAALEIKLRATTSCRPRWPTATATPRPTARRSTWWTTAAATRPPSSSSG